MNIINLGKWPHDIADEEFIKKSEQLHQQLIYSLIRFLNSTSDMSSQKVVGITMNSIFRFTCGSICSLFQDDDDKIEGVSLFLNQLKKAIFEKFKEMDNEKK